MKNIVFIILPLLLFVCCKDSKGNTSPNNSQTVVSSNDSDSLKALDPRVEFEEQHRYLNHVAGHDERDTIVGKFNGKTVDTLFVVAHFADYSKGEVPNEDDRFYMVSSNKHIPRIQLYGVGYDPPKIVNEGDLDGNGTCEVGYLHTGLNSQWRQYRIFTLVNGHWRYLVDNIIIKEDGSEDCLSTPEWFRETGVEIAEPGPKKGWVKINYATRVINAEIKDTLVRPTFSKIRD